MSRILIDPSFFFGAAAVSSILTTFSFCWRSCLMTSSRFGASIVADLSSPLTVRAVYVNCGILYLGNRESGVGSRERRLFHRFPIPDSRCPLFLCRRRLRRAAVGLGLNADHAHQLRLI